MLGLRNEVPISVGNVAEATCGGEMTGTYWIFAATCVITALIGAKHLMDGESSNAFGAFLWSFLSWVVVYAEGRQIRESREA